MTWSLRRQAQQPTPVFLPGESHGQRSLAGYSPWGLKESDTTEVTSHAGTRGVRFSSIDFVTPWTAARQPSLSITNSQSLLKLMSIESVMPSSHLILCHPLLLPLSIFASIRVFSHESVLHIRWPKYWSFSFNDQSFQ